MQRWESGEHGIGGRDFLGGGPIEDEQLSFEFVSADESDPVTPLRNTFVQDDMPFSMKRPFVSPFSKITVVNNGSTPQQHHELKAQSKPVPLNMEFGSRPGFSATPGPKLVEGGGSVISDNSTQYELFDDNSQGKGLIYSNYKDSVIRPPQSPDMRDMQLSNMLNQLVDSPEVFRLTTDDEMASSDDVSESYNRAKFDPTVSRLFQDAPLLSDVDFANIEHDVIDSPWNNTCSDSSTNDRLLTQADSSAINSSDPSMNARKSFLAPKPSIEHAFNLPNSVQNKNPRWNRSRNSSDRSTVNSSMDSELSASFNAFRKSVPLDVVRISNDSSKNANKQEFIESPRSKTAFKDFNNKFRQISKTSFQEAESFANKEITTMPEHSKWRVYVELAELAKKNNDAEKARRYYISACSLERRASTTWLEWSKMEEENGRPIEALKVLKVGLTICKLNDTLLPRSIKLHERLSLHEDIREFLFSLKYEPLERSWKSILEGCLFEARIGNYTEARDVFKFLMSYVPWYGPIYYEAFRLEERDGADSQALAIIRSGLRELPRYGPLWFGLLRIMERRDIMQEKKYWQIGEEPKLSNLNRECEEAVKSISKELTWRVHFEKFQAEERAAEIAAKGLFEQCTGFSLLACRRYMFANCRRSLTQSLLLCPSNLRWKLLLVGARLELGLGNIGTARNLIQRSFQEVPSKSKASVYIECSRMEEYVGNFDVSRSILIFAKHQLQNDWRLCLESVLLEARRGNILTAINLAKQAASLHPGTGRIWALYIQLNHRWERGAEFLLNRRVYLQSLIDVLLDGPSGNHGQTSNEDLEILQKLSFMSPKDIIIRKAIMEVPKSGEVWCEQGRCRLNPFLVNDFDMAAAQQSFAFAVQFTPQYGDTFIELLRLELLSQVILRYICDEVVYVPFNSFILHVMFHDHESDTFVKALEQTRATASSCNFDLMCSTAMRANRRKNMLSIFQLKFDFEKKLEPSKQHGFPQLLRRCNNADPNYGSAWFHCRELPYDIATQIMSNAQQIIRHEIENSRLVYCRAVLIYLRRVFDSISSHSENQDVASVKFIADLLEDFRYCDLLLTVPGEVSDEGGEQIKGPLFLEVEDSLFSSSDFVTGIIDLNRTVFNPQNPDELRRRYLFGIDQIVS